MRCPSPSAACLSQLTGADHCCHSMPQPPVASSLLLHTLLLLPCSSSLRPFVGQTPSSARGALAPLFPRRSPSSKPITAPSFRPIAVICSPCSSCRRRISSTAAIPRNFPKRPCRLREPPGHHPQPAFTASHNNFNPFPSNHIRAPRPLRPIRFRRPICYLPIEPGMCLSMFWAPDAGSQTLRPAIGRAFPRGSARQSNAGGSRSGYIAAEVPSPKPLDAGPERYRMAGRPANF